MKFLAILVICVLPFFSQGSLARVVNFSPCINVITAGGTPYGFTASGKLDYFGAAPATGINLQDENRKWIKFKSGGQSMTPTGQVEKHNVMHNVSVEYLMGMPTKFRHDRTRLDSKDQEMAGEESHKVFTFVYNKKGDCLVKEATYQDKTSRSTFKGKQIFYNRDFCRRLRRAYKKTGLSESEAQRCLNDRKKFAKIFEEELNRVGKKEAAIALPIIGGRPIYMQYGPQEYHTMAESYAMLCGAIMKGSDTTTPPFFGGKRVLPKKEKGTK